MITRQIGPWPSAETKLPRDASAPARPAHLQGPFLVAAAIYSVTTLLILVAAWRSAEGHFIYPLDDVYINMAVAKNFALHGVWGVSPYEFSSCTSSPLYVLLLSGVYRLFGPSLYAPLVLSWLFGLAAIYVAAEMVRSALTPRRQTIALFCFVLLTPLFVIGTLGMEHSMHLLLVLLFLRSFDDDNTPLWLIGLLTVGLSAARYEGLLIAAAATVVLAIQRGWLRAAVIAVCAWIPVVAFAIFSITHGGYWLPNSIAIKGLKVGGHGIGHRLLNLVGTAEMNTIRAPYLLLFILALLLMTFALWRAHSKAAATLAVLGGAALLHWMTADVGWVYRYEDYLLGAGIVVMASACPLLPQSRRALTLSARCLFVLGLALLAVRSARAAILLPKFSRAIYLQQWQTARLLHVYYPGHAVAANDIGAINYQTDLHCLDLGALATAEIFDAKRNGRYNTAFLEQAANRRGIEVAVVYDEWFAGHPWIALGGPPLPKSWIRVRRWTVPEKLQLGGTTVSFYALNAAEAELLRSRLDAFQPQLPKDVTVDSQ